MDELNGLSIVSQAIKNKSVMTKKAEGSNKESSKINKWKNLMYSNLAVLTTECPKLTFVSRSETQITRKDLRLIFPAYVQL